MATRLRVEFLIPLKYNDGTDIEPEKFFKIKNEVLEKFGGISIHPLSIEGAWIDKIDDARYYDNCKRFEVCAEKCEDTYHWLSKYKEQLKNEFKQKEIYMIAMEVKDIICF